MTDSRTDFDARVRVLGRKHRALANGVTTQVRKDGLIVVRPTRRRPQKGVSPLRIVVLLTIGFFAFKGFMLASMGDASYEERLAKLEAGTSLEQVGAAIMKPDRVSMLFASAFVNLTRG